MSCAVYSSTKSCPLAGLSNLARAIDGVGLGYWLARIRHPAHRSHAVSLSNDPAHSRVRLNGVLEGEYTLGILYHDLLECGVIDPLVFEPGNDILQDVPVANAPVVDQIALKAAVLGHGNGAGIAGGHQSGNDFDP